MERSKQELASGDELGNGGHSARRPLHYSLAWPWTDQAFDAKFQR